MNLANTEDLEGWGPHEPGLPERPDTPDGPEGSDLECSVPELGDGRLRLEHECRGHWPYDRGCDDCVQLRGRTPARRVGHKHETPHSLAADFLFVAGKHWKVLVLLMVHTGMVGMVVCGGDRERDVQSTAAVLNEIGVGGLSVEVATDNEAALKSLVERGLAASSARRRLRAQNSSSSFLAPSISCAFSFAPSPFSFSSCLGDEIHLLSCCQVLMLHFFWDRI